MTGYTQIFGDLGDEAVIHELFNASARPPVDVLVNNAGSYPVAPIIDCPVTTFDDVIAANASITYACLREAARSMSTRGGGSVVNVASLNASRPGLNQAAYNSAKAAIVSLTRSAAVELAAMNIRVNAVSPGLIERPGLKAQWPEGVYRWNQACPLKRLGTPRNVADACVFLASPMADWLTGQDIVDGGISAIPAY